MEVQILFFGKLTELTGRQRQQLSDMPDTDAVMAQLYLIYPGLQQQKYQLAVDEVMIQKNTMLADGAVIALMPPFSGG